MLTRSFQWNGATITVRTRTGRDELNHDMLVFKLAPEKDIDANGNEIAVTRDEGEAYHHAVFARFVTQSTVEGHLGFDFPSLSDDKHTLRKACDALLDAPAALLNKWRTALAEVDTPPVDPDLLPVGDISPLDEATHESRKSEPKPAKR